MNKTKMVFIVTVLCALTSCVSTKTYTDEESKMRMEGDKVFVIMDNGNKVVGEKLKFPLMKLHMGKLDGREIDFRKVTFYQDKNAYYGKVGNDKDYAFAKQLKRGKINLYYYDVRNDRTTTTNFVFQKDGGKLTQLSIGSIADMLKDNTAAYSVFTKQFGGENRSVLPKQLQNHPKVLFEAIDIYNGNK